MNYTDEKQILQQFGDSIINCVFERVCAQSVSKNIPMRSVEFIHLHLEMCTESLSTHYY